MRLSRWLLLVPLLCSLLACAADEPLPPGFDPQRHMLVAEVQPGMKGYGLSVFSGSKIERFDVEVISILRNFTPRQDVVLIRAAGANLEHTGPIAGMSGSPIYLTDAAGRSRLIGAFAYGWPMMKDPVAGVQPIQYMLSIPLYENRKDPDAAVATAGSSTWPVYTALASVRGRFAQAAAPAASPLLSDKISLVPLVTPLAVGGLPQGTISSLSGAFLSYGLTPLQSGGAGGSKLPDARIEPGSVLAVPLLTGDADMTAVGTCTEVVGRKVYGFGHPFTSEGPVAMPMCGGQINAVIANLSTSFKLGSASQPLGTLLADQVTGIAGELGKAPATAPFKLRIAYADGTLNREYHYDAIVHPQFTPLLTSAAIMGSLSGSREMPRFNTVDFAMDIAFSDGHKVHLANLMTNVDAGHLFMDISAPIAAAAENPFRRVMVQSVEGSFQITEGARQAEVLHAGASRLEYRPGETVKFFVTLRPFRSVEVVQPLEFKLPDDLPDGAYALSVSDVNKFVSDEHSASPFRFTASNLDEVFTALNELVALRSDCFYLRLARPTSSVAVGRTSLPNLPGSQRQLLLSTGRSDITPFTPAVIAKVPAKYNIEGSADLAIQVSREMRPLTAPVPSAAPPAPGMPPVQQQPPHPSPRGP